MATPQTSQQSVGSFASSALDGFEITETVLYRIVQLAKAHRNSFARRLSRLNVYIGQEQVLLHLWNEEGLTQADLAGRTHTTAPTVSKMLGHMESAGLVSRERETRCGRLARVYLTDHGRELKRSVERLWEQAENELVDGLTASEWAMLIYLLARLRVRPCSKEPG